MTDIKHPPTSFFDDVRESLTENKNIGDEAKNNTSGSIEEDGLDEINNEPESQTITLGRLPLEARRALVNLMRTGVMLAQQKPKLFEQICRHEKLIHDHLADMYLRLLLDMKAGAAMILQQEMVGDGDFEEDDIYPLIYRRTLSLYDTLLLLVIRKYYQEREAAGEQRIIIDAEQIEAYLTPFLPLSNSSRSDRRTLNSSMKKMSERKIVNPVRGEEERYEITPVIRYVVNAEFLEKLLDQYIEMAKEIGLAEGRDQDVVTEQQENKEERNDDE